MQVVFLLLTTAAMLVVSTRRAPYAENVTAHDGHTVLLGGLFPLSENSENTCGDLHANAVETMEAMVFTIHKINRDHTLLPNVTLTFDIRDTCSIPNEALEECLSFVQAPLCSQVREERLAVSGIVGAGRFSDVSEAVATLFRLFQIPQISYGSSAISLSNRLRFDYFFRTLPSDEFLARAMADIVNHFGWSYIIALYSNDTYGRSGLEVILERVFEQSSNRRCVAIEIPLPLEGSEQVYDAIIANMTRPWIQNASVALLYGHQGQATDIMRAIRRALQAEPKSPLKYLTWIGCDALLVDSMYHDIIHGMLRIEYRVNMSYEFQEHFSSMDATTTGNPYFREYLESRFPCSDDDGDCTQRVRENYVQGSEISSIIDAVHAFAHTIHALIEEHCPDGNLCSRILIQRVVGVALNGTMIRDYLLQNLSFPGLSASMVQFDSSGNDQSSYFIKNLQRVGPDNTYEYVTVGTWDPLNLLNISGQIEWHNQESVPKSVCSEPCGGGHFPEYLRDRQCCWVCKECHGDNTVGTGMGDCTDCEDGFSPNPQKSECVRNSISYLTWSDTWGIVIILAATVCLLVTGFVSGVYVVYSRHRIIKASSRELSAILLAGLAICYLVPFFFLARPSKGICAVRRFLAGLGFAVCYSALLVKTNRIHRIFNRSPEQLKTMPRFISPLSQVIITFILISVQVLIATLWLAIEHPSITYTHDHSKTELKCGGSSNIGLLVTIGYNFLLLILTTYFAFLARNIPENFNEVKFINVTLYATIIIWLAFIPTYFTTVKLGSVFQNISFVVAIILSATTILCCVLMPKVIFLFAPFLTKNEGEDKTVETGKASTSLG